MLSTGWSHKLEVLHEERPKALPLKQTVVFFRMELHQEACRSQDKKWTSNQLRLRKNLTT